MKTKKQCENIYLQIKAHYENKTDDLPILNEKFVRYFLDLANKNKLWFYEIYYGKFYRNTLRILRRTHLVDYKWDITEIGKYYLEKLNKRIPVKC